MDYYLRAAWYDLTKAFPYATIASAAWIVIAYFFNQSIIDAVTGGREVTRKEAPRLYNLLENLCISRGIPMPKLKVMDTDGAECVRERPQPAPVFGDGDVRIAQGTQRPRAGSGAWT